jgi:hypothetical protein
MTQEANGLNQREDGMDDLMTALRALIRENITDEVAAQRMDT